MFCSKWKRFRDTETYMNVKWHKIIKTIEPMRAEADTTRPATGLLTSFGLVQV